MVLTLLLDCIYWIEMNGKELRIEDASNSHLSMKELFVFNPVAVNGVQGGF